ncbi:hypothetical protein [Thermomonospora echinospora]|uniref:hypothetical protein n=1 Tax=Thermomonospora echinospora TaxID=1992 RepID=UPI000CDEAB5F|nr:hypothetical protein [Thermomonospora echinospora]
MRVKTIAAGTGAAAVLLLPAPSALAAAATAAADIDIDIDIEPGYAMAEETVTVVGTCDRTGDDTVRIVSQALNGKSVRVDSEGRYRVPVTVRRVGEGTYTVTAICEPSMTSASDRFRVRDGISGGGFSGSTESEQVDYPRGGAGTGGGGTAENTGGGRPSAGSTLLLGTVIAAVIGGVVLVRRRGKA